MSSQNVSTGIFANDNMAPEGLGWLELPEGDGDGIRVYQIILGLIDGDEGVVRNVVLPQVYELLDDANRIAKRIMRVYPPGPSDPNRQQLIGMHLMDNGDDLFEYRGNYFKMYSGFNQHPDAGGPMVWWNMSRRDEQGDWTLLYSVDVVHAFWHESTRQICRLVSDES